jgi:hypothetical protein
MRGVENHVQVSSKSGFYTLAKHMLACILLQVKLATLPGDALKDSNPIRFQTGMVVTHNPLNTPQTAFD